jgi:hypothetical protein
MSQDLSSLGYKYLEELVKSQDMQENQQVVFMSDGRENVRRVQEYPAETEFFPEQTTWWKSSRVKCHSKWWITSSRTRQRSV